MLLSILLSAVLAHAGALPAAPDFEPLLWSFYNVGQPWRMEDGKDGKNGVRGADIHLLDAWKTIDAAPGVTVAVIDGGFELGHPDLEGELLAGESFSFLTNSPKMAPLEEDWDVHGNLVAGVIGANGRNLIGVTGISRHSRILPIEAVPGLGKSETDGNVARAILYAADHGARVINCSFGKYSTSDVVRKALETAREKNILVVAGAGNDGKDITRTAFWPAAYSKDFDNVVSVAATDREDHLWSGTNYGTDLAAPGSEIFSTGSATKKRYEYFTASGTSMAAPHVSGVALLMIELYPEIRASDIKRILIASSDPLPGFRGKVKAGGRINAARALAMTAALKNGRPLETAAPAGCDHEADKKVLARTKYGYTAEWTLRDDASLSAPFVTADKAYNALVTWIRTITKLSGAEILKYDAGIYAKFRDELGKGDPGRDELQKGIEEINLILSGKAGRIHPITCAEGLPYREYLKVIDLRKYPQEFTAFFLRKGDQLKILGDFYRDPSAGEGEAIGVSESRALLDERAKLVREGWLLVRHLHDHTFVQGNPTGDFGGNLIPSEADLEMYTKESLPGALVSNGIETIELTSEDIAALRSVK